MVASEVCVRDSIGAGGGSKPGGDKEGIGKSKCSLRERTSSNHITRALKDAFESTANAVVQMQEALQVIRSLEKPAPSVQGVAQRLKGQSRDIRKLHRRLDLLEQKTGVAALPAHTHALAVAPAAAAHRARRLPPRVEYPSPMRSSSTSPSPTPTPDPWGMQTGASCTTVRFLSPPKEVVATATGARRVGRRVGVEYAASTPVLPPPAAAAANKSSAFVAPDKARLEALGKKLLKAAHDGRVADVHRLLEVGADVDFCGRGAWTACHRAAARAHAAVLQLLLARGASPDARDCYGFTPLHMAAYNDATARCVTALLDAGAGVHLRDHAGRTALHSAAEGGNGPGVLALMAAGASTADLDHKSRTPYDVAKVDVIRHLLAPY